MKNNIINGSEVSRLSVAIHNANKSRCEETLEDGCDTARYLCSNADATLGCDDLGLKYWHTLFRFRCINQLNRIRLKIARY